MPPKPHKIAMMSHILIGSPRMALAMKGDISVLVKNRANAFENEVNSKAKNRKMSLSTPKMHRMSKSNCADLGMFKMSTF